VRFARARFHFEINERNGTLRRWPLSECKQRSPAEVQKE
jgi:hypothetical protein